MEEKSLRLEDALNISKGDRIKVRDSWEIRSLSKVISNPLVPNKEYTVKKIKDAYIGSNKVIMFELEGYTAYSHYWFSSYRKKLSS
ncbi:MAG: hypothetical protein AABX19_00465 [Nanoarchaeota archaeon]